MGRHWDAIVVPYGAGVRGLVGVGGMVQMWEGRGLEGRVACNGIRSDMGVRRG